MKSVPAATFTETCLALLDAVDPEGIVITKRGKPVARLVPLAASPVNLIGSLRHRVACTRCRS